MKHEVETRQRVTPLLTLRMQNYLMGQPLSAADLSTFTGLRKRMVQNWLKLMLECGYVHVARWGLDANNRPLVPMYLWGNGKNVERPGDATTSTQRMRKHRMEKKKDAVR